MTESTTSSNQFYENPFISQFLNDGIVPDGMTSDNMLQSLISGFGITGLDRSNGFSTVRNMIPNEKEMYELLHEGNNYATNIIEELPESMGQKHPIFKYEKNTDRQNLIQKLIDDIIPLFVKATTIARMCGGAAILIKTSGDYAEPLNPFVMPDSYTVLEGGIEAKLVVKEVDINPFSVRYQKPVYYGFRYSPKIKIHYSRVLQFNGVKTVTENQAKAYKYWGIPVLKKSLEALMMLKIIDAAFTNTLDKFSRLVIEIENFYDLMSTAQGKKSLNARANQSNLYWNLLRVLLVQKGEKVYHLTTEYTSLLQASEYAKTLLASTCDTPYSRVFNVGKSKGLAGFGADSASVDRADERQWSDIVFSKQKSDWLPHLIYLLTIWWNACFVIPDDSWEVEFPAILQLSEKETEDIEKLKAETEKLKAETEKLKIESKNLLGLDSSNQFDQSNPSDRSMIPGRSIVRGKTTTPRNQSEIVTDDATPTKKVIPWFGWKIGIQYQPLDKRFNTVLPIAYGRFYGTKDPGDGMGVDVYVNPLKITVNKLFKFKLTAGIDTEYKYVVGFDNVTECKNCIESFIPKHMVSEFKMVGISELNKFKTS